MQFSIYKFNLDPAGDNTGLRNWGSANSIQLAEISLFDASGAFASRPRGYTEALATRKRTLDDTPADQRVRPPPSVTPDTPTRKRPATPLWGEPSVHKDLLQALWPEESHPSVEES